MKLDVPLLRQSSPSTCLPACLRIVFRYFGVELSEDDLSDACGTTQAGTTLANATRGVRGLGLDAARIEQGTLEDLLYYLIHGEPVIAFLGVEHLPYGDLGSHAVVVCGMERDHIVYVDPAHGREVSLDPLAFLRAWRARRGRGIVVQRH